MATENVVTVPNLGNEFDLGVQEASKITLKLGDNLSKAADGTINASISGSGALSTSSSQIYVEQYFGKSQNGTTQSSSRNLTMTRTAVGRWTIAFSTAHPDGINYHASITAEEQGNLRDTPDITVVQGSPTANGFNIQITTGDNGGGADAYVDTPFTISIASPISVITSVTLDSVPSGLGIPSLPSTSGEVVSDNFQDGNGNAPFNLQIRSTVNMDNDWEALIENVPYGTIPSVSNGSYTLETLDNGDGTFDHLFRGTSPIIAFQTIAITGGIPTPSGSGTGLSLYSS